MKTRHLCHMEDLPALRRIEGQVRGIQRMIKEEKYCVDILVQICAVKGALIRVEDKILAKHLNNCVEKAVMGKSVKEKKKKMDEICMLIRKTRKGYK